MNEAALSTPGVSGATHTRILVASIAAFCVANVSGWILPDLVNEFITVNKLSESQAGFVGTVELAALAISSIIMAKYVRQTSFFTISVIGAVVAVVFTLLSIFVENHVLLLMTRALTGVGEGATLMAASAAVAGFPDPDRAYGQMNVVNVLYGTALIFSLPTVSQFVGDSAAFPTLFVGLALLTPLVFLMPRGFSPDTAIAADGACVSVHHDISFRTLVLAGAIFVIAMNSSSVWSFLIVLGMRSGLSEREAIHMMGIVAFVAAGGCLLATILGTRFGRLVPLIIGVIVLTICIVVLTTQTDAWLYRICASLMVASLYFVIPYFMGYAAADDGTGRGAALISGAFLLTVALGPYVGGLIIEHLGVGAIAVIALSTNGFALLATWWFDANLKRFPPNDAIE